MATTAELRGGTLPSSQAPDGGTTGFRPDVQALRAVAVLAVVFNHLWPTGLSGGYVGVDVFFVISGFLISAHLNREISRTGRIRLAQFYARRIRRLLPAAFLVLLASMVAAYFLLPFPRWASSSQEAVASALYWENWLLAAHSVEYSNYTATASLEQHYWSLSVEEQFYLFWPLLLLLLFKLRRRRAQIAGVAVTGLVSLAFSAYFTEVSRSQAYFVTPTRVWEFAIGALIALGGAKLAMPRILAIVAFFAGMAMIIGSALRFDHHTAFPGYLALIPTLGAGLVIVAGARSGRQWHMALSSWRPLQFLGNISYSLYLWHWPLILLAPFALGDALDHGRLTMLQRLAILAVAVALASLSKVLVEDRGRTWSVLAGSTKLTFTAMIAGMIAVVVTASGLNWSYHRHVAQAERDVKAEVAGPCRGAAALIPGSGCADPYGPAKIVDMGPANEYWNVPPECGQPVKKFDVDSTPTTRFCDFSMGEPSPRVIWLVGDSHAQQWLAPLVDLAREHKWVLKIGFLGGCPFAKIQFRGFKEAGSDAFSQNCMKWTALVAEAITQDRPRYVFTSFFARQERADDQTGRSQTEQYRDGLMAYWRQWVGAGVHVVVLIDPPLNGDVRAVDCVALNPTNPMTCAADRVAAQPPDPLAEVVRDSKDSNISYIDLTDYFCDERKCYGVVGHVVVYYDANHMNVEFSRSLKPMIAAALGLGSR